MIINEELYIKTNNEEFHANNISKIKENKHFELTIDKKLFDAISEKLNNFNILTIQLFDFDFLKDSIEIEVDFLGIKKIEESEVKLIFFAKRIIN